MKDVVTVSTVAHTETLREVLKRMVSDIVESDVKQDATSCYGVHGCYSNCDNCPAHIDVEMNHSHCGIGIIREVSRKILRNME
jgi:hypothetical protein